MDSRATLCALNAKTIHSNTAASTVEALNTLANHCKAVRLVWVQAHVGIRGNEEADSMAKEAATNLDDDSILELPPPLCEVKTAIDTVTRELWTKEWTNYEGQE